MTGTPKTAYDFTLAGIDGHPLALSTFVGRPIVIVNTASKCGFTPQYADLQSLWEEFGNRGLIVLGLPCNDFGGQDPEPEATISVFCRESYGATFPMTSKIHVRGLNIHPFYAWLAAEGGFLAKPRWNFHKYLIGRDGRMKDWFASFTRPTSARFRRAILRLF